MEQEESSKLLTTPLDVLMDLYGQDLIFVLWRVVVFSWRSAYFFFVTSRRVLLWAVFTDLGVTLAERNLSITKGESLVMGFSSIDSRTIKIGKEVDTSSISLFVNVLG